ncbi:Rho GTPase-activating protein domain [Trinorchestia longiramus]|nr:Rho GTPase-activating protein domain [Trinorchestia longiramus]
MVKHKQTTAVAGFESGSSRIASGSPLKSKKGKSFKFLHKKDKEKEEKDKDEKKKEKKEEKKKEREKEKVQKLRAKEEKKRSKKDKKKHIEPYVEDSACVVFGVPLSTAVERSPTHDGLKLPLVVRQCIDYVEQNGLECEGIYRLSGVKSKVQQLRRCFNSAAPVSLSGHDPHVVASLLKQFLRELPEPVLTVDMTAHFEDASQIPGWRDRAEAIRQLLHRLPTPNSQLVCHMLAHMGHIIDNEVVTKMNYQNVCIVLSPTMRISHRVLNVFFQNHSYLFGDVRIRRYRPPVSSSSEVDGLLGLAALRQEVARQDSVLAHLHRLLAASPHNTIVQERLWETQRIHTLLKRKVKICQREEECEMRAVSEDASSEESQRESVSENTSSNSTSIVTTASNSLTGPTEVSPDKPLTGDTGDAGASTSVIRNNAHEIPRLPKPVSARSERTKFAHKSSDAATTAAAAASVASVDSWVVPPCNSRVTGSQNVNTAGLRPQGDHVTVINIDSESDRGFEPEYVALPPPEFSETGTDGSGATRPAVEQPAPPSLGSETRLADAANTADSASTADDASAADVFASHPTAPPEKAIQPVCVDAELVSLVREEAQLLAHHAELLAMNHDLTRKLHAETAEIARLREEIQELQTLYGYRTYSYDSSESGGESESGFVGGAESDNEEEVLFQLQQHNSKLQNNNEELVRRIQEEREAVVLLKARLRQSQASHVRYPVPAAAH